MFVLAREDGFGWVQRVAARLAAVCSEWPEWLEAHEAATLPNVESREHCNISNRGSTLHCRAPYRLHATVLIAGAAAPRHVRTFASASLADDIKAKNKEFPVMVYSKSYCPFSHSVKSLFEDLEVDAKFVELDELGACCSTRCI